MLRDEFRSCFAVIGYTDVDWEFAVKFLWNFKC
jgi:hypothetical protein